MNIIDYVKAADQTFKEKPFGPVDSLILAQLSYCKIEAVLAGEKWNWLMPDHSLRDYFKNEYFAKVFSDGITDAENMKLFAFASASRRFRDLKIRNVVAETNAETHKQFAAMTFELDKDTDYVAFRGTDGSMLGWREDFNMSYMDVVSSQEAAVQYVEKYFGPANLTGRRKKLYLGGHSKGGNLSVYSALRSDAEIHPRICQVYSHDGPGFRSEVIREMTEIQERDGIEIIKQVPQTSLIGMLMESSADLKVVKSDGTGVMQHSAFTWQVDGDDFVYEETLTHSGEYFDRTITDWLLEVDDEKRQVVVNAMFDVFDKQGITSVHDLKKLKLNDVTSIMSDLRNLDDDTQKIISSVLKAFAGSAVRQIPNREALSDKLSQIPNPIPTKEEISTRLSQISNPIPTREEISEKFERFRRKEGVEASDDTAE